MDNYRISADRAQQYFLRYDQAAIANAWQLSMDSGTLYADFLGRPYGICRKTGEMTRLWSGERAQFGEVLSLFDLLCHEGSGKYASGKLAPVNSLKGRPVTAGVGTDFHLQTAAFFEADPEAFRQACENLGGTAVAQGDIGYRFSVFADLPVVLKFYGSDEDFPASVTLLWDENMLSYVYYETVFYIAGFLLGEICREMARIKEKKVC